MALHQGLGQLVKLGPHLFTGSATIDRIQDRGRSHRFENIVALALREAVTNIIRHSDAKHCRFHLQKNRDRIQVTIADDGSLTNAKENAIQRKHF